MKHVIIGGTHGLGHEIAKGIQATGEETYVTGRSYDKAKHGDGLQVNLAIAAGGRSLAYAIDKLEGIKSFYWVAGAGYNGDFAKQEAPDAMGAANFTNVLLAAQTAYGRMAEQGSGNFVTVSSTSGLTPRADEVVYSATKHAQVGFARSLGAAAEKYNTGVKVALINPGGMQTEFWDGHRPDVYDEFLDPARVAARILLRVSEQQDPFYEETIPRGSL